MSGAKGKDLRSIIKMVSVAGTDHAHVTRKNRRNISDWLVLHKLDPVMRRYVKYKESR